jgi:hypothetical protein
VVEVVDEAVDGLVDAWSLVVDVVERSAVAVVSVDRVLADVEEDDGFDSVALDEVELGLVLVVALAASVVVAVDDVVAGSW